MKSDAISNFLTERIDAGDIPSAVYLVAEKGEIVYQDAIGNAVVEPMVIPAETSTIYDVASLTKVLVTTLLSAMLIERGALDPNEPIGDILTEFYTSSNSELTVNELAMHITGLPAWKPFYLLVNDPDEVLDEISRTFGTVEIPEVVYSDLNFITLGAVIERLNGAGLDEVFGEEVVEKLALVDTQFDPPPSLRPRIAANEEGNGFEQNLCAERFPELHYGPNAFRDHTIWGEVHDGNSNFMNGVAGHAGLFSTAEEILTIAKQFLPQHTELLKPETCELFATNFTPRLNEHRSFGFQLASTQDATAGTRLSPESFGHNGFTGTSLWVDPVTDRIFILLTNRTHVHGLPFTNINELRRRFHGLAVDEVEAK
jgi:serine-type D-Ala-D-Ala carboxypeptidase